MNDVVRFAALMVALLRMGSMFGRERLRRGKPVTLAQGACEVSVTRGKYRRVEKVEVGFLVPGGWRFNLRRENWFDRVTKWIGLAREFQTHDDSFDRPIYIECDDPLLERQLSAHRGLREQLMKLFHRDSVRSLMWADGWLWFSLNPGNVNKELEDAQIGADAAAPLAAAVAVLREHMRSPVISDDTARDPTRSTRKFFAGGLLVLVIVATLAAVWQSFHEDHQIVVHRTVIMSAEVTFAAVISMLTGLFMRLGGTSRAQRVFLDILIVGIPATWFATSGTLMFLNEALDETPPRLVPMPVDLAWFTTSKKGRHDWYANIRWPDALGKRPVKLDRAEYALLDSRSCVDVLWRAGRFGDGWIERYQAHDGGHCDEGVEK